MAIELATAYISIIPSTDKLESGIRSALNKADRNLTVNPTVNSTGILSGMRGIGSKASQQFGQEFSTHAQRMGAGIGLAMGKTISSQIRLDQRVMQGIGHAAGTALKIGMVGAMAGVGTILFKGFERLESLDRSRKQLEHLGKSADDVKKIMADVNTVVEGTPIALNDALGQVPKLLAANIKPGKDLTAVLTSMADAAGFSGDQFSDIALGFDQIINAGKLTAEELNNQFRNLPLVSWLAKSLGTDEPSIKKMISDGKIGIQQVVAAVQTGAGGMAKAAGETIEGAMQNTMTAMARLGANVIAAAFGGDAVTASDNIVESLKAISGKFDQLSGWVTAHRDEIHQFFVNMGDAAGKVADALGKVLEFLAQHPNAVKAAGAAFLAWEAISVTATVASSLSAITTSLTAIKAGAAEAGTALGGMNAVASAGGLGTLAATLGTMAAAVTAIAGGAIAFEQLIPKTMTPDEKQRQAGQRGMMPGLLPGQEYQPGTPGGGGPGAQANRRGVNPLDPTGGLLGGTIAGAQGLGRPPNPADFAAYAGIKRAADLSGGPYIPGVSDCSGYVSQVYSAMTGTATHFTTTADFAALGFRPGYMPGALNIGVNPLPGMAGHMAATLPNGVNIESGGTSGGMMYGSQTGALSAQFPQQWYFMPGGTFDQGGALPPGYSWVLNATGQPELVLNADQAQRVASAVDPNTTIHGQAKGAAPGPSPDELAAMADQSQQQQPDRLQGYIPASAGNVAPVSGGGVFGDFINMGGEAAKGAIQMAADLGKMAASAAAAGATMGAGAAAGPGAGMGIQIGADIAKRGVDYGTQAANIGIGALTEILSPFGAPRWLTDVSPMSFVPQNALMPAATTSLEKAAAASMGPQPLQPGQHMPEGAQPGVPIPPGPNFTSTAPSVSGLTTPPPDVAASGNNYGVTIGNIYATDANDIKAQIDAQQRLAVMRYAGRP